MWEEEFVVFMLFVLIYDEFMLVILYVDCCYGVKIIISSSEIIFIVLWFIVIDEFCKYFLVYLIFKLVKM